MKQSGNNPVMIKVLEEISQGHSTRQKLLSDLETLLGKAVISFFTSFRHPVMIDDTDADMLIGLLQTMDLSKGLAVIVSSPGGSGVAAERIIKAFRAFSKTGQYEVIVPSKAKSAATMICLGASKILMAATSELGPIDPQVLQKTEQSMRTIPACRIIDSYRELIEKATKETGKLEPYLQQLARYNATDIKDFESMVELSKSIVVGALSTGMMNGIEKKAIEENIKVFLDPNDTKTHSRPIFIDMIKNIGLAVEEIDYCSKQWELVYEIFVRTDHYVSTAVAKCIENKEAMYVATKP